MLSGDANWQDAKIKAEQENSWFTPEFINLSIQNIARSFLDENALKDWSSKYNIHDENTRPKKIGIVMAGNIPLVGFHDWLCVFNSGHFAYIKPSSKDKVLIRHLLEKVNEWDEGYRDRNVIADMLKNCDAYIATGSNNTSRYFEHYFGKYPNIIRKNRTSIGILSGKENLSDLEKLADDVFQYFGLGCRNITKIYVPAGYDFVPLLTAFKKYNYLADHHKYKNNYDYNLALHLLNKKEYMTNGSVLLVEDNSFFSPISQLNFEYYKNWEDIAPVIEQSEETQCIIGEGYMPFGQAQCPRISDYADKVDTLDFLTKL